MRPHVLLLLVFAVVLPTHVAAQASEPLPPNPFADFQTIHLANGLKVWFRQLPESGTTAAVLTVPYGWDRDPVGREGTAHFLEHVLLSDRDGRTDTELWRELEARGGSLGGATSAERTTYSVTIATGQADYGMRWLGSAVMPRAIPQELVERTREPIAIETQARRRSRVQKLVRAYLMHPVLRPPRFWKREFDLDVTDERLIERHDALHAITADDLLAFYQTYYVPQQMTLMIVGDVSWEDIEPAVQETFGTLPRRPTLPSRADARPVTGFHARNYWSTARNTLLRLRYRLHDVSGREQLQLMFLQDLLENRLFERLRLGGRGLVYGVSASTVLRGNVGYFELVTGITPQAERTARAIIAEEIERIKNAGSDTTFYADRDALTRQLRLRNATAPGLARWASRWFYDPRLHNEFPDVGAYYATVDPDSLEALARRLFARHNTSVNVRRPLPLSPALLGVFALAAIVAAMLMYRMLTLRRIDMSRVRFVGRLRPPPLFAAARILILLLVLVIAGRLVGAAAEAAFETWFVHDNGAVQVAAIGVLLFAITLTFFALAGVWPRKLLVFEHELRVKSLTYRSAAIPIDQIAAVTLRTPAEARRAGKRLRGHPYGRARGVLVEQTSGSAVLFHVRDNDALLRALQTVMASAAPNRPAGKSAHRLE
ncbi:MAG TPA: pitrilysin family protein [Longimicrobiales bacterium]|nr:pitrilysin family protein [Longimicrobiales bacterium]